MLFVDLGFIDFQSAFRKQEETVRQIVEKKHPEIVYLLEHPHVFTVGRGGKAENLLAAKDWQGNAIELIRINRGGDVTYHGPGQLVGYPHLRIAVRGRDVHRYLRDLEETLIRTAARFDVPAFRTAGRTGVWTKKGKLASLGVGIRRWVSMHGFALNVNTDLRYFQLINPCGITGCPVTSIRDFTGSAAGMAEVKSAFQEAFVEVFGAGACERSRWRS